MSTKKEIKIKKLLDQHIPETILLASWLSVNGFSYNLQQRYRKSGWLESVGVGAFKRPNEIVHWQGALCSLQKQVNLPVYFGGPTALSIGGFAQYARTEGESVYLFSPLKTKLPAWFNQYPWIEKINHIKTSFIPGDLGLEEYPVTQFLLTGSSVERAIFECLYLTPEKYDIMEVYQIMSGLVNLRPNLIEELLTVCTSIKVKRLFLYMAKKANHQWLQFVDLSAINLGKGDRSIIKNGVYNSEFCITIPDELAQL